MEEVPPIFLEDMYQQESPVLWIQESDKVVKAYIVENPGGGPRISVLKYAP